MSFLRSTALRASSLTRAVRPTRYVRAAELQPWQRAVQRRTYASGHGAEAQSSEVPWMAAAVAGTVGGLYIVMTQDTGAGHHDDHHGEAHETHEDKDGEDDESGEDDSKDDDSKKEESKNVYEGMKQGGPKDGTKTVNNNQPQAEGGQQSEDGSKAATGRPDKKKAADSRQDAPKAGESGEADPAKSDKADPRGKPKSSNETSGKQEGLSNSNTHHSTQISKDPTKSKKGEGVAETAKVKGTVSTNRPGAENKEERGKAQQDNDA